jgi:hypothetical protein
LARDDPAEGPGQCGNGVSKPQPSRHDLVGSRSAHARRRPARARRPDALARRAAGLPQFVSPESSRKRRLLYSALNSRRDRTTTGVKLRRPEGAQRPRASAASTSEFGSSAERPATLAHCSAAGGASFHYDWRSAWCPAWSAPRIWDCPTPNLQGRGNQLQVWRNAAQALPRAPLALFADRVDAQCARDLVGAGPYSRCSRAPPNSWSRRPGIEQTCALVS